MGREKKGQNKGRDGEIGRLSRGMRRRGGEEGPGSKISGEHSRGRAMRGMRVGRSFSEMVA